MVEKGLLRWPPEICYFFQSVTVCSNRDSYEDGIFGRGIVADVNLIQANLQTDTYKKSIIAVTNTYKPPIQDNFILHRQPYLPSLGAHPE